MYGLEGRRVLITGGATGIGRKVAIRMAEEGCRVGIFDIDDVQVRQTLDQASRFGKEAMFYRADVGDAAALRDAYDRFRADLGDVDILINNAAINAIGRIGELTLDEWRAVFRVNVEGVFSLCSIVAPIMTARGSGRIINMASWFGKIGKAQYSAYCASKFAVIGLTQSLAAELAPAGVTVNAVCPGTIMETGMREMADKRSREAGLRTAKERESEIPLGRVGLPDDVAKVVAFLASGEACYMTGQAINVTGGLWMN
ncbi:SDR family NAD(P)-dependent oxidoreductase [Bradyrhizobium sp.]|jgi:NAD(P)-dependent dehydrogenase (short-subunit alcohol dehydrogenase family)|uniref:SDR family NAD(P)-dependent oxidoreductase n=1 Tax=Bradyrhizobium sp. TaxID=376 RepID=UPI002DDD7244|nr:SDR family NAD(P)-dependent oxidoreductase [Bradyrhizobium sp.]HEV2160519.1 SDR family NAD(P)-dependent oxidoreductase [Bradyrhizobium sp.]